MSSVYELLLKNEHQIVDKSVIFTAESTVGCAQWSSFAKTKQLEIHSWLLSISDELPSLDTRYGVPPNSLDQGRNAILIWPKSKILARGMLDYLSQFYDEILVAGANDCGGKSIHKAAPDRIAHATKLDAAKRCNLWRLSLVRSTEFNWLKLSLSFQYESLSFVTLPGVFNYGKLDVGTRILLDNVPAPKHGRLLDLGCGSGVIGLTFKHRNPELDVHVSDIDAFALKSTELNSLRLGLPVTTHSANGLCDIEDTFDFIITNPPFHQGKKTDYTFAERLFKDARSKLVTNGQLWIIANTHLPYEDLAKQYFQQVEQLTCEKGFKLLVAY